MINLNLVPKGSRMKLVNVISTTRINQAGRTVESSDLHFACGEKIDIVLISLYDYTRLTPVGCELIQDLGGDELDLPEFITVLGRELDIHTGKMTTSILTEF